MPDARAEFDIDAIADQVLTWEDGFDGRDYCLNRQGFVSMVEDADEFWAIVAKAAF